MRREAEQTASDARFGWFDMEQQIFERSIGWVYPADDGIAFETILEDGEAAMEELIRAFTARGLPPGAVIEVEFAVRKREPAFA